MVGERDSDVSVAIELRGLGYALDGHLEGGSIVVQRTRDRVRRVEGTAVLPSPVSGEATIAFDLVSLPRGYREDTVGTIRIADPAAEIDICVAVELSEERGRVVEGVAYPDEVERPCIERQLVGVPQNSLVVDQVRWGC